MQSKFNELTNDFLIGIRFNNYRDWYHAHKEMYKANVHEPMVELANRVYELMHEMDSNFTEVPKISRINRDIRFSKIKLPYKESKWFFLRGDGKPDIVYPRPSFYFEITPDIWRYGMYYAPGSRGMAAFRAKVEAEPARFKAIAEDILKAGFYSLEGEMYKRPFKLNLPEGLIPEGDKWLQRKELELTRREEYSNTAVYTDELPQLVFDGYKRLYELYLFLNEVVFE